MSPEAWYALSPAQRRLLRLADGGRTPSDVAAYLGLDALAIEIAIVGAHERLAAYDASGQRDGDLAPGLRQRFSPRGSAARRMVSRSTLPM